MSAFIECIEDPAISSLPAVLNPVELCRRLREHLPWQIDGLTETQVRPLRHHAGKRCIVAIALRTVEGPLSLAGSVYSTAASESFGLTKAASTASIAPD